MNYKKFSGAASAALMIVIVMTMVLAPAAGAASKYKVLYRFQGANGAYPFAGLIFDAAGNLYGTTVQGGASDDGTVFKLAPSQDGSWKESVLHSFNGSDGRVLYAGLIFDAAGNLYGTTYYGGASDDGTVFKLAPNQDGSWKESVLHSFNKSDGAGPRAGLIFDAGGNLYGTTIYGGASDHGTVFKLAPNQDGDWTESLLHSFNKSDEYPYAGLIFDAAGNLYGTTYYGGVFGSAQFSSWRRIRTEAGRRACCTRSTKATDGIPIPTSSSMRPEISTAQPGRAASSVSVEVSGAASSSS